MVCNISPGFYLFFPTSWLIYYSFAYDTFICCSSICFLTLQVINYDMPDDRVTYVHRIGRTGRLHVGKATSFIDPVRDNNLVDEIVKVTFHECHFDVQIIFVFFKELMRFVPRKTDEKIAG